MPLPGCQEALLDLTTSHLTIASPAALAFNSRQHQDRHVQLPVSVRLRPRPELSGGRLVTDSRV